MIKRILLALGIFIVLIIASLFILPVIFKDDIIKLVKDEANNSVNAKIDFGDFDLSLISNFPDFSFSINEVSVAGIDTFEADTLVSIGNLLLTVDLMSVINGEEIAIKTVSINRLRANAIVLKNGVANWDIAKASDDSTEVEKPEEEADTAATAFKMSLKKFEIKNTDIVYDDRQGDMYAEVKNLNFELKGDFTQDFTTLLTKTTISALTVAMGNIKYLNKAELEINADLDADLVNSKYTFKENEFRINQLILGWDGWVAMPGENIDIDITFGAKKTEFKNILSLIPAVYAKDFEDVKTSGKLAFDGFAKGTYTDASLPAFGIKLLVENAMFQYPDLPKSVNNINIKVDATNPGGSEDNTVIDVSKFHVELAGNPVDIHLLLKTPVSDPQIDCGIKGVIDLEKLKDVVPQEEGESSSGLITADIILKGRMSTIEQEKYEEFDAVGNLAIENMKYTSADLPQGLHIQNANLIFSPKYVNLTKFDCTVGKSDFNLNGKIENFIPYVLTDSAILIGSYQLKSHLLDANEFMAEEVGGEEATADTASATDSVPMTVVEVPRTIDFTLASSFDKILYDNMEMTDVGGLLVVRDETVSMKNLKINMLQGTVTVNGSYDTKNVKKPAVNFNLDIAGFDIPKTVKTFNTVKKLAPILESCTGAFSTRLDFIAALNEQMEPNLNTLTGGGKLTTRQVVIEGSKTIDKLADAMKNDKYKQLKLENINATYQFTDGRLVLKPFDTKIGNSKATIYGSNGFDETLEYTLDMIVPTKEFGGEANAMLGGLAAMVNKTGANVSIGDEVKVKILITGTVSDPKVKLGGINPLGGDKPVKEQLKEEIKEAVKVEIDKAKEEAKQKAKEEAEKLIKDAEQQADKIKKEAKDLADQAKKEGYAQAKQVEDQAKNPLQKMAAKAAADKLRKETDRKVDNILSEANKKADGLVETAKIKAAGLQK